MLIVIMTTLCLKLQTFGRKTRVICCSIVTSASHLPGDTGKLLGDNILVVGIFVWRRGTLVWHRAHCACPITPSYLLFPDTFIALYGTCRSCVQSKANPIEVVFLTFWLKGHRLALVSLWLGDWPKTFGEWTCCLLWLLFDHFHHWRGFLLLQKLASFHGWLIPRHCLATVFPCILEGKVFKILYALMSILLSFH